MALAACGSDPAPEPVEQIVVREPGAAPAPVEAAGDIVAAGRKAFAMCTGCHVAKAGEPSAAGPNLYGVVGRAAGSLDDFAYSEELAGSGITWDAASLDRYLADPQAAVPGTSMSAGAVPDDDRRAAIIAYLETLRE
ncbi:c-type cytochrome [Erythrobacter sp. GH1-10]|uniref:c-type cytochrome n=1 Tax=Erythrobacter sp. GH1-10 TaxID=3349334 RepID=UPI003877A1DF